MGATGRQGGAAIRRLMAAGWPVRAVTRNRRARQAIALAALGAEVVEADMADRASLIRAFRGTYGVFSVQNPMISKIEGEIRQGCNVVEAAAEVGVGHLVYASAGTGQPGTGVGSWESKLKVEERIRALGVPHTVLRPMAFMELMTHRGYYPAVAMWHLMPKLTGPDLPIHWISVEDVGVVVAEVFADPQRHVNTELKLCADTQSNAQCRAMWTEVTGRPPRSFPMPLWLFERFTGDDLSIMWRWLRTANLAGDAGPTRQIVPNAMTVRQWLTRRHTT
jgi:uncharacterized protein YbjT (DUF2867 family)